MDVRIGQPPLNRCKVQDPARHGARRPQHRSMNRQPALFCALARQSRLFLLPFLAVAALGACSPAFNWREVRPDNTALTAMLPCKPDKGSKTVPLGGQPTQLSMVGCETSGAMFAIASADMGDAQKAADVLAQWAQATLVNMKAPPLALAGAAGGTTTAPLKVTGATLSPAPVLITARGVRADNSAVASQAAYFAQGSQVFQAVIYADNIAPEVAEAFFSGLKLQ